MKIKTLQKRTTSCLELCCTCSDSSEVDQSVGDDLSSHALERFLVTQAKYQDWQLKSEDEIGESDIEGIHLDNDFKYDFQVVSILYLQFLSDFYKRIFLVCRKDGILF